MSAKTIVKFIVQLIVFSIGLPILRWLWKATENAALGWVDDQVALWLEIKAPTPMYVLSILQAWGVPVVAMTLLMYGYHLWYSRHSTNAAKQVAKERSEEHINVDLLQIKWVI